jgi:HSP20 family molecular chaperone IbpA
MSIFFGFLPSGIIFSKDIFSNPFFNSAPLISTSSAMVNALEKDGVIHQGIAKRSFSKAFTIADDVEIRGAELKNGLLKISLEKIIPEGKKPKKIDIK